MAGICLRASQGVSGRLSGAMPLRSQPAMGNRLEVERLGTSPSHSLHGKARCRDVPKGAEPDGQHRGWLPDDSLRLSVRRTYATGLEPRARGLNPDVSLLSGHESLEETVGGSFVDSLIVTGPGKARTASEIRCMTRSPADSSTDNLAPQRLHHHT
jgi:hypothetical protein